MQGDIVIGYGVISVAAREAHILNICIDPDAQSQGHGRRLLRALVRVARAQNAERIFLEVRPSNPRAIALYFDEGFNEIGRRPRYYPAQMGREDAIVMAMELLPAQDEA
jgi:ribosomal-protein-alanine N-acetyltransferase